MNVGSLVTTVVGTLLAIWIVLTIAMATTSKERSRKLSERLGLFASVVPNWNFFAPHPGQYDYHILYRTKQEDRTIANWTELTELTETPQRFKWAWNPGLYKTKTLFDIGQDLTKNIAEGEEKTEPAPEAKKPLERMQSIESGDHIMTTQYMLLLNYITKTVDKDDATDIQFMLMRSNLREDEPTPMFVSNFHKL